MWLLVLGLTITNAQVGGNFVNDYQVPGSESSRGLAKLQSSFPSASGYSGQIVGYLDQLDKAAEPARSAGLTVEYGGGAGQIGQAPDDALSETIGLACAFLLLLIMFGSFVAALVPLVGAVFSVGAGPGARAARGDARGRTRNGIRPTLPTDGGAGRCGAA